MSADGQGGILEGGRGWKCPKTWLWWWLPDCINLLNIVKLYSYNGWDLWYVNYNSVRLFKKKWMQWNEWGSHGWLHGHGCCHIPLSPSSNQEMCMLSSSWGNDQAKNNSLPHPPLALSGAHILMLKLQFLWWCPRARAREDSWFLITIGPGCSSVLSLIRQVSFGHSPEIRTSFQLSLQSLAK